jgi:hypothetical protein
MKSVITITTTSNGSVQRPQQEVELPAKVDISIFRGNDEEMLSIDVDRSASYVRIIKPTVSRS